MKKFKLIIAILICLSLLLSLFACSKSPGNSDAAADNAYESSDLTRKLVSLVSDSWLPEMNVTGFGAMACWGYLPKSVDEMFKDSDDVIVAKVLDEVYTHCIVPGSTDPTDRRDTTRYVEVLYSFKDFYKAGDIVPVAEFGWTMEDGRDNSLQCVPLMKPGQSVLLFANGNLDFTEYSDEEWAKCYADTYNYYMGVFHIDGEGNIVPSAKFAPELGEAYIVPGSEDLKNFDDFIELAARHKS